MKKEEEQEGDDDAEGKLVETEEDEGEEGEVESEEEEGEHEHDEPPSNVPLTQSTSLIRPSQSILTSEAPSTHVIQPPIAFIWALTFTAGISGLLFGYDTGVISSTLVSIDTSLSSRSLTTLDKSLITACTSLFALVASPLTGYLADRLGRKWIILIADLLFVIGALWQAVTSTVEGMVAGRSVVGLAVGAASLVVPLYISELSPAPYRGRLVTLNVVFITVGQVVAYIIGYLLSRTPSGWRTMVGLGAVPAIFQCFLMLFLPETPRWLVKAGRSEAAKKVLKRVYGPGSSDLVSEVLRGIEREVAEEDSVGLLASPTFSRHSAGSWTEVIPDVKEYSAKWGQLFHVGGNRRALIIACMLQGLQQLCGFNSLMYFSASIFSLVGFSSPTLASLSIAITNFIFTVVSLFLIDSVGRRRMLLWSIPIMIIGLLLSVLSFAFLAIPFPNDLDPTAYNHETTTKIKTMSTAPSSVWPLLTLLSLTLYVCGYALGIGCVPWQQSELFPLSVRSLGSSLSTATNWTANFLVGLTFLPMMQFLTPSVTFGTYAVVCSVGWVVVRRIYPETTGLGLEDVGALLKDGWGVERVSHPRSRR